MLRDRCRQEYRSGVLQDQPVHVGIAPRAEVMMSFRRAEYYTYIAQLLGRMVRTPLARRIELTYPLSNHVHLFLPYFDTRQ